MADEELIQQAMTSIRRLDIESVNRDGVEGIDVANDLHLPEERHGELYDALRVAERRGLIEVFSWPGGMGLPEGITRP